ncbi:sugar-binding protein [Paenibacillus sp. GCM10023252]|uniref:sugar-binding protein n=1 Tax=Paenibacillus sp. GCM10023252 TaxID=3252649 RepID=UPI0036194733
MKRYMKTVSSIIVFSLLLSIFSAVGLTVPQASAAGETSYLKMTFEESDPNFGSLAVGEATQSTLIDAHTSKSSMTIASLDAVRWLQVATPANERGSMVIPDGWSKLSMTQNNINLTASFVVQDTNRDYNLRAIQGDWGGSYDLVKIAKDGKIYSLGSNNAFVERAAWSVNAKFSLKLSLYKDSLTYDLYATKDGSTTKIADQAPLPATQFNGDGIAMFQLEAPTDTTPSTIMVDDVETSGSDNSAPVPVPQDETVYRETTFEEDDSDPTIAGTQTGESIRTSLLDDKSPSEMRIVEFNNSRMLEVTTLQNEKGNLGIPFDNGWSSPAVNNSYTLESTFVMKDNGADARLYLVNSAWTLKSYLMILGRDGKIYARSNSGADGAMAARGEWEIDKPFTIKLVTHLDSKSYDLYIDGTKVVNHEPMQASTLYSNGLAAFMLETLPGIHPQSVYLVDNIKLSGSNTAGPAPVVNPNPGTIYNDEPQVGEPVTYYVSPTGSDTNNGTSIDTPFKTPQKAADVSAPGDTILLRGGEYPYDGSNRQLIIKQSGAKDPVTGDEHYITFKNYPGETPILKPTNGWEALSIQASYIIIDGITVQGDNRNITVADGEADYENALLHGDEPDFDWNSTARTQTGGISVDGRNRVENGLKPLHHIIIRNNHIFELPGGGIGAMEADYVTIENNHVHGNAWYTMWAGSGISILHSRDLDNNTSEYKNFIRNNIVYDNETKVKWIEVERYSDGNGIIVDANQWAAYKGRTLVSNNISYNNGGSGIHAFYSSNADIVNNTIYQNGRSPHINYAQLFAANSENINLFNNIVYGREGKVINSESGSSRVIYANNVYYNGNVTIQGPNDVIADPQFVSLTPDALDFHLKAGSPAIDRGTRTLAPVIDYEGDNRPQGGNDRYDIGAYESNNTSDNPIEDDVIDIAAIHAASAFIPPQGQAMKGSPTIDGNVDEVWSTTKPFATTKFQNTTTGATSVVRTLWDDNNFYVLMEVTDAHLSKIASNPWEQDSVEMFLDENNGKTIAYEADDGQYRVNYENEQSTASNGKDMSFTSATKLTSAGYLVEARLPLATVTGTEGMKVGFDAQTNDDQGAGKRDSTSIWSDTEFSGWSGTNRYGEIKLVTKLEEIQSPAIVTPSVASFNKNAPADIPFQVDNNGNSLAGLKNGSYVLVKDQDYTVSGSVYSISKAYLSAFPVGTVTITFDYTNTVDQNVKITITGDTQAPGGGGGTTNPEPPAGSPATITGSIIKVQPVLTNGHSAVVLNTEHMNQAIAHAVLAKEKELVVDFSNAAGITSMSLELRSDALLKAKEEGIKTIEIKSSMLSLHVSPDAIKGLQTGSKVTLDVKTVDPASLPESVRDQLQGMPVFDFNLSVNGQKVTTFKDNNSIEVRVPYSLNAGDKANAVVAAYVTDNGSLEIVRNVKYDEKSGVLIFKVKHFSKYAVVTAQPAFKDMGSYSWAQDSVTALAARHIISGISKDAFAPQRALKRAEYLKMLMEAHDLVTTGSSTTFTDVLAGEWYYDAIASAQALGIISGYQDGSFGLSQEISREEMAAMTARVLKAAGVVISKNRTAVPFTDEADISDYAFDAVQLMNEAGWFNGRNNGQFAPKSHATRAEAAVLLARVMSLN